MFACRVVCIMHTTCAFMTSTALVRCFVDVTTADEERFRTLIELAIQRKEVSSYAAFRKGLETKSAGAIKAAVKRKRKNEKVLISLLVV